MFEHRALFKALTTGFLPLLLFIIVDQGWGLVPALTVAILTGLVEFGIQYYREKRFDFFILCDTILVVGLGLLSLVLESSVFFKLKPALIEIVLAVLVGLMTISNTPWLFYLCGRYFQNLEMSPLQWAKMKKMLSCLFFILVGHSGLVVWAALYLSEAAWGFISGIFFYILLGFIMLTMFLVQNGKQIIMRIKYRHDEWFPLVDGEGKITGKAPRKLCHQNPKLLHAVVHGHIFNGRKELYLQRRSLLKDIQPGKWDTAVGGHIGLGESLEQALRREAREELGLKHISFQPLLRYVWHSPSESELVHSFKIEASLKDIDPDPIEILEGKFWEVSEIEKGLNDSIFTPNFVYEFNLFKENKLL